MRWVIFVLKYLVVGIIATPFGYNYWIFLCILFCILDITHEHMIERRAHHKLLRKIVLRRIDKVIKNERKNRTRTYDSSIIHKKC